MPNTKISELSAASTLTGTEQFPVVQGGVTKRTTVSALSGAYEPANAAIAGAWTAGSMTLSSATIGNGTLVSRYRIIGKTVDFTFTFTLGSTSAITGASKITGFPAAHLQTVEWVAPAHLLDSSARHFRGIAVADLGSADTWAIFQGESGDGQLSSTAPFTWAVGDVISVTGTYETP